MVNFIAFDPEEDRELLEASYNALRNRDSLDLITEGREFDSLLAKARGALTVPDDSAISFQNLFRISAANGQFYIAQCLINTGFSMKGRYFSEHKYRFQLLGIAELKVELGNTLLRKETRADKFLGPFLGNDIDFPGVDEFNDKYYLVSDKKEAVLKFFNRRFLQAIANHDEIVLTIRERDLFITFENDFKEHHSRSIEDILSNCGFLNDAERA